MNLMSVVYSRTASEFGSQGILKSWNTAHPDFLSSNSFKSKTDFRKFSTLISNDKEIITYPKWNDDYWNNSEIFN